jgi:hypothetical protein
MRIRVFCFALVVGVVSMTSGCHCFRCAFPNAGWRFHQGGLGHGCAPCGPCAPGGPVSFRPPAVVSGGHDCVGCNGGVSHLPAGYPSITYPPIIGNPIPIPGGTGIIPNNQLPAPMPDKKKDGN